MSCKYCMKPPYASWKYIGPVPNRNGREYHMWECMHCKATHCTYDKEKPSKSSPAGKRQMKRWTR
jgi:hypothetical protein